VGSWQVAKWQPVFITVDHHNFPAEISSSIIVPYPCLPPVFTEAMRMVLVGFHGFRNR
jgi:hypothetical protein